ncbi:LysR family transcriptional regulator [Nocardioides cynanchi]|uniref:LysR family transcriptional regulator n=1 Tax=Nocardioides cynanchi TaxID=2558918 RepID=UPI001244C105|nr:LysR family transcriptional regulator [Nocardioides cynanchi]
MLDIQRLRVFRAVVASGSVQAAADHLGYTPSAVSQSLSTLQRETGLVLFEKAGRGIAPTPTARVLAAESEELMGSLSRLGGFVDHLREGHTGSLSIGSFASAAQFWIPQVAKGLRREFPDLVLELSLTEFGPGPGSPERHDIDITTEPADGPGPARPGYSRHVLVEENYRVVAPRGHHLLAEHAERVPMAALDGVPMVDNDFHDNTCGRILAEACRAAGFSPRFVARSEDHHTALAFVAAGIGVTVLPELAVPEATAGIDHRELVNPAPRRRIVAQIRDGAQSAPPVACAIELIEAAVADTVRRRGGR